MTELTAADIEGWVKQAWDEADRETKAARRAFLNPELRHIYYNIRGTSDIDHEGSVELMEDALAECRDADESSYQLLGF